MSADRRRVHGGAPPTIQEVVMNRSILASCLAILFAGLVLPDAVRAQDEGFDRTPVDCISLNRIRRTEVIDDHTILFHLRGNRIYRTQMERACLGLEREQRFTYQVHSSQLCDNTTITVLERTGFGLGTGFTCRLGSFYPVSTDELEEIRRGPQPQTGMSPVEPESAEGEDEDPDQDGE
jgi:hypothetical protein